MKKLLIAILLLGSSLAVIADTITIPFFGSYYVHENLFNENKGRIIIDPESTLITILQGNKCYSFQITSTLKIEKDIIFYCTDLFNRKSGSFQFIDKDGELLIYLVYNSGLTIRYLNY